MSRALVEARHERRSVEHELGRARGLHRRDAQLGVPGDVLGIHHRTAGGHEREAVAQSGLGNLPEDPPLELIR
jgi:hypothetical protein